MDAENADDCFMCPEYAKEIFDYLKQREVSGGRRGRGGSRWAPPCQPCRLPGEVCPARLHADAAEPERRDEGHPGGLAGGGAGEPGRRSFPPEPAPQRPRVCFQENFELFHETLYLAVKITDHYLSATAVHREMLQLVGSTAMLIASKFEVRSRRSTAARLTRR